MESSEILWQQCLQLIREKVSQRVYDVWFAPITLDCYDAGKNAVMLRLPSRYIYEYIEECQVRLMGWALGSMFGQNVKLGYRIVDDKPDTMPTFDFPEPPQIPHFKIPGARERLEKGLKHFMGDKAVWLPCYKKVADWLTDNKGRGLLCIGTPGLGKTRICCDILPVFLKEMFGKEPRVTTLCENDQELPALLKERVVIVDGLGREDEKIFGKKNTIFQKLCDAAARQGTLLIITTHLSTTPAEQKYRKIYPLSIQERYGNDVLSRLRATTTVVGFEGENMWK